MRSSHSTSISEGSTHFSSKHITPASDLPLDNSGRRVLIFNEDIHQIVAGHFPGLIPKLVCHKVEWIVKKTYAHGLKPAKAQKNSHCGGKQAVYLAVWEQYALEPCITKDIQV